MYNLSDAEIGIGQLGSILPINAFFLFVVFIICYFTMWKGVQVSGKIVWFTATFPYVVLIMLSIKALFLDGSLKGLEYYLTPNMSTLSSPMVTCH